MDCNDSVDSNNAALERLFAMFSTIIFLMGPLNNQPCWAIKPTYWACDIAMLVSVLVFSKEFFVFCGLLADSIIGDNLSIADSLVWLDG